MLNSDGRKVLNAAFGMPYTLRAELNKPDGKRQTLFLFLYIWSLTLFIHGPILDPLSEEAKTILLPSKCPTD